MNFHSFQERLLPYESQYTIAPLGLCSQLNWYWHNPPCKAQKGTGQRDLSGSFFVTWSSPKSTHRLQKHHLNCFAVNWVASISLSGLCSPNEKRIDHSIYQQQVSRCLQECFLKMRIHISPGDSPGKNNENS